MIYLEKVSENYKKMVSIGAALFGVIHPSQCIQDLCTHVLNDMENVDELKDDSNIKCVLGVISQTLGFACYNHDGSFEEKYKKFGYIVL